MGERSIDIISFLLSILQTTLGFIFGTIVGSIVTGLMINQFVVKKVMRNKDIQDILKLIKDAKDALIENNKRRQGP